MRRDLLELDTAVAARADTLALTLGDAEALRLLLTGGSVIDWHKAAFADLDSVDRLLHLHLIDPSDPVDAQRIQWLFAEAVTYVEEYLQIRVPAKLRAVDDVREIFLWASNATGFRRTQVLSCVILKLMHVMQHLEAAELRTRVNVAERRLHDLAHQRIVEVAEEMRDARVPLVAFYGSRKTRASVIAKLLSKRDDIAARVFDKIRYRVVVPTPADLDPALAWMVRNAFPFNQVIPGQSHNSLLDPREVVAHLPAQVRGEVQPLPEEETDGVRGRNEFSGRGYRMINFIVDVPVRLADADLPKGTAVSLGRVVYVTTEFQIVDEITARHNEEGDNAHALYKRRQHERVRSRLTRGQYRRG